MPQKAYRRQPSPITWKYGDIEIKILRALVEKGPLSAQKISKDLGIRYDTIHEKLNKVTTSGWNNRKGKN